MAPATALALRPATPDDDAFLLRLFAGTRERELGLLPLGEGGREAFVAQQFAARRHHHAQRYPGLVERIVLVGGVEAGHLVTAPVDDTLRIVDVALLPERRGHGVGTQLIRRTAGEAEALGRSTSLHVERGTPAERLYLRLGFAPQGVDDGDLHRYLVRPHAARI